MMEKSYVDTVRLLLESVPVIFQTPHFAMKGGTAISLFVQKMPRLSVDIDVVCRQGKIVTVCVIEHQVSRLFAPPTIQPA